MNLPNANKADIRWNISSGPPRSNENIPSKIYPHAPMIPNIKTTLEIILLDLAILCEIFKKKGSIIIPPKIHVISKTIGVVVALYLPRSLITLKIKLHPLNMLAKYILKPKSRR